MHDSCKCHWVSKADIAMGMLLSDIELDQVTVSANKVSNQQTKWVMRVEQEYMAISIKK